MLQGQRGREEGRKEFIWGRKETRKEEMKKGRKGRWKEGQKE